MDYWANNEKKKNIFISHTNGYKIENWSVILVSTLMFEIYMSFNEIEITNCPKAILLSILKKNTHRLSRDLHCHLPE